MRSPIAAALVCAAVLPAYADPPHSIVRPVTIARICHLIQDHADSNDLPRDFLARLIWKESRFDPEAVSPAGAEGIAQFMPGTAKMRGLADAFNVEQAIPASAAYLGELKRGFGNLGLAAAAYNAGETRVGRWLRNGGFLPLETEEYVLDIMGEPTDNFAVASYEGKVRPLDSALSFGAACRKLPAIMASTIPMARINMKPWGIQVAGNFRRAAAIRQWSRARARFPALLANHHPVVSRVRSAMGRRGIYTVRIGAQTRSEADQICSKLRGAGGACIVLKNR